jgi:hypothetical protein
MGTSFRLRAWCVSMVSMLAVAGSARAIDAAGVTASDLLAQYPGLHMIDTQGRVESFYGMPMNAAATPQQAAADWLFSYDTAFGAGKLDLTLERDEAMEGGRFRILTYSQKLDGLPVEFGMVKILVLNLDGEHRVVMASAKVASSPAGGLGDIRLTGEQAQASVAAMDDWKGMQLWSAPEMLAYVGEGDMVDWIAARPVWKFTGEQVGLPGAPIKKSFLVDASTGELLFVRNEVLHVDVTGSVRGRATPTPLGNAAADWSGNLPTDQPIAGIRVRINGSSTNSALTDANGNFTIPWTGTSPVTVDCSVGDGQWVAVQEQLAGQALMTASASATPGTPVTLNLNPATGTTQYTTAQVNAFIHQTSTHNFWKSYAAGSTILDAALPAKTTVSGTCNAFYDGTATNFYPIGGGCNNTSFSSVVSHEYGHHIVNRLGLAQNGFGEGFGDVMSIMQYDDLVVGRYFLTGGSPVRTPDTDMIQYPCSTCEVHLGGEVLGGAICKVRRNFGVKYGTGALERCRQLAVSWSRVTLGGNANDSAVPRTLTEFLTVNDTDGNINNGTPDFCEIVNAFGQHGVTVSGFTDRVTFTLSGSPASLVPPGQHYPFTISVAGSCTVPQPGTLRLYYRNGSSGAFTAVAPTQTSANVYAGSFDIPLCGSKQYQYYFGVSATTTTGGSTTVYYPSLTGATPLPVTSTVGTSTTTISDTFETDTGWTVGPTTASTGAWVRVDPVGTTSNGKQAQPEDDHTPTGTQCWVTGQGAVGGAAGAFDVDGGSTILTSPAYNFAGYNDVSVAYWRWYSNGAGAGAYEDTFRVDVSTDNGSTWVNAETIGPGSGADPNCNGGWVQARWNLSATGRTPTSQIKVRFTAEDVLNGSLVEAALDDFEITGVRCVDPTPCPADFNQDGGVDGADVQAFFLAWQAGDSIADTNQDGGVDGADVQAFFIPWQNGGC